MGLRSLCRGYPVTEVEHLIGRTGTYNCCLILRERAINIVTGKNELEFLIVPCFSALDHDLIVASKGEERADIQFNTALTVHDDPTGPYIAIDGLHGVEGDSVLIALTDGDYDMIVGGGNPILTSKDVAYACRLVNYAVSAYMREFGKTPVPYKRRNINPNVPR